MQKYSRILITAAVIGLGFWGWRVLFPSPQHLITTRLMKLARTASFDPQDGALTRANKARQLLDLFTPDVQVEIDLRGYGQITFNGRDEVQSAVLAEMAPGRWAGLKVEFSDISVVLGPDRQTAVANLTGKATLDGQSDFIVKEFNFSLRKVQRNWLIYRVETVKTLSENRSGSIPQLRLALRRRGQWILLFQDRFLA